MLRYSRREVLRLFGGSALSGSAFFTWAGSPGKRGFLWGAETASDKPAEDAGGRAAEPGQPMPFRRLGKLAPRPSKQITASPLSVGFETLDRQMFDPERVYPHLAQLGVKWARVQTGWRRCEPEKGRYEFGWLDAVVDRLLEIGVQPWFNLGYGNRLYTPEAKDVSAVGWAPIFTQEARTGWTRFVQALAKHFANRVRHWEIWNEPNIPTFWKPQKPNAKDYVDLVKLTAPLIRQAVPKAIVIGGAFAGMPVKYLQECLEAGLAEQVDRISYHPYRPLPEKNYAQEVAQFRKLLERYRPSVALWQGECGCPSMTSEFATGAMAKLSWTEQRQAKWLLRRILCDLAEELELTSYFHTVDLLHYNYGEGKTSLHNYKGLLRGTDYTPKPSYFAYQCLCTLFDAQTRRERSLKITVELPAGWANQPGNIGERSSPIGNPASRGADQAGKPTEKPAKSDEGEGKAEVYAVGFHRQGWLLAAYWAAADLFQPWRWQTIRLQLPADSKLKLAQPVLIDPLRQEVYELPLPCLQQGRIHLADLPLADYPWLVTDRQALAGLVEG